MADGPKNALVQVEIKGETAEKLITRTSDGIGGLFKPWQIKRVAKAEAVAALVRAQSEIDVLDLQRRTMHRLTEEDAWHQYNMEQIAAKAAPLLTDGADTESIDDDWTANFFEKSRNVSNDDMQSLWSRVLAGEVNVPGSFSRRTVNFLSDLDRRDCESFTLLCGYCWMVGGLVVPIFDVHDPVYLQGGITFNLLNHLESIGLIKYEKLTSFQRIGLPKKVAVDYHGTRTFLEFEKDDGNGLEIGQVLLTRIGEELAPISGSRPVPGFLEYVRVKWGALVQTISEPSTEIEG